jgi:acyl-CoA synthetase (AMP-forming)/AMP-acid ligase II
MAPTLTRELIHALPGKRIFVMYGATEASARLSYLPPEALHTHIGSIGHAIPGVELRVLGEDGLEVPPGEVGEIVARGPNIMEGYWGDPEETARVLDADGYHTGDLGRRDDEGFLWIVGRKREMLKVGAHRISPKEIEEVLLEHPALLEAAVLGVPDDVLGEAIEAHVVARPLATIDLDELAAFARERLAAYKVPRRFIVRPDLPKSAAGKILKESLRSAPEGR